VDASLIKDARFWDRSAREYAASPVADRAGYEQTVSAIRQRLTCEDAVLEIGCGTGTTALRLAPGVGRILATDISRQMIAIARERALADICSNVVFEVAASDAAPWPLERYDVALAFNVLHLVPSLDETVAAVNRRLKPGGLFISKTPCLALMNPLLRFAVPAMQLFGKAPSVSILSPDQIESALVAGDFEIIERGWHGTQGRDARPYIVARKPRACSSVAPRTSPVS
jgi:ubiquinone/menaquinone biosynthesis C-methylase UbiE